MAKILELFKKEVDHYKSIDELPIWNWFKIHETNDITYLAKKKEHCSLKQVEKLEGAWRIINNEFIDTFGINEDYKYVLELQRDITVLKIDMYLTGDMSIQTFIDIKELELKELLSKEQGSNITKYDTMAYVSKYMGGMRINEKDTTVAEYYGYLNIMKKQQKSKVVVNESN